MAETSRLSRAGAALALACLSAAGAPAQEKTAEPRIEVSARVDRADLTIGDKVRYEITVEFPAGGAVELPAVKGNIGRLELLDARVSAIRDSAGRASVTHTLSLAGFDLGEDTLPPQRVEYRAAGDTATWVAYTPPTYLRVKRLTAENATEIADIDETGRLPGTFWWGYVVLALLALAAWGFRVWLRNNPLRAPEAARAPLPPYEDALEKLRALEASGWPAQGRGREFAFALSEILREYLGLRYGVDAMEATTAELIERTAGLPFPAEAHAWLREVSEHLDAVKFATGAVSPEEAGSAIAGARAFLEATRPAPEPPSVPDVAKAGNA